MPQLITDCRLNDFTDMFIAIGVQKSLSVLTGVFRGEVYTISLAL